MVRPTGFRGRPVEVLHSSSEQIRRLAELLAEVVAESAPADPPEAPADQAGHHLAADAAIRTAQRSFVTAMRLALRQDPPE